MEGGLSLRKLTPKLKTFLCGKLNEWKKELKENKRKGENKKKRKERNYKTHSGPLGNSDSDNQSTDDITVIPQRTRSQTHNKTLKEKNVIFLI